MFLVKFTVFFSVHFRFNSLGESHVSSRKMRFGSLPKIAPKAFRQICAERWEDYFVARRTRSGELGPGIEYAAPGWPGFPANNVWSHVDARHVSLHHGVE
jgi:hypothetical protein